MRKFLVSIKYQVAGGSARFMFVYSNAGIQSVVSWALARRRDVDFLLMGYYNDSIPEVLEGLRAWYTNIASTPKWALDSTCRLVSSLMARMLAVSVDPETITKSPILFSTNTHNSIQVFDLWFIASLVNNGVEYTVCEMLRHICIGIRTGPGFDPNEPWLMEDDRWNFPMTWHWAGFDAVYWETPTAKSHRHLVFVVLTRSDTHGFVAFPFTTFLSRLNHA